MSNKENWEPDNGQASYRERMRQYYNFYYRSDEDTDDASETEMMNDVEAYSEIKEQMYHDKLAELKNQLKQLENFTHPTYLEGTKELEEEYKERQFRNEVVYATEMKRIEHEHTMEKEAAYTEFEEKRMELKQNLFADLEHKQKTYEIERDEMDIVFDTEEVVQLPIRKLRRRGQDLPEPKKRKSSSVLQVNFQLTEEEIDEDLRSMNLMPADKPAEVIERDAEGSLNECKNSDIRVENGKLYYEKYWYHRGQQIYYETQDVWRKNSAVIISINSTEVWVRRTIDSEKFLIYISDLLKGTVILKRRCA